jgi:hypothetical protein
MGSPRNKVRLAAVLAAATLVAGAAAAEFAGRKTETELAIETVVTAALEAEHNLATLPASAATEGVTSAMRDQLRQKARATIDQLYRGDVNAARVETIIGGIDVEGTRYGIFVWDGGVHDISFRSTTINGDTATVVVHAVSFLVVSSTRDGERSRPEGGAVHTFTLQYIGDRWFVTDEEIKIDSGQGP